MNNGKLNLPLGKQLSKAISAGKERVAPGCLSPGASLRVVKRGKAGAVSGTRTAPARTGRNKEEWKYS
jgi:hypothetical protein